MSESSKQSVQQQRSGHTHTVTSIGFLKPVESTLSSDEQHEFINGQQFLGNNQLYHWKNETEKVHRVVNILQLLKLF